MAQFNADITDSVLAACRAGAEEAAEAIGRVLDTSCQLATGEANAFDVESPAEDLKGPGLVILLVVEDKAAVARTLEDMGVETISDRFLDFLDPWGNRIEIIGYQNIQFTKAPHVLRAMGLARLHKSESALKELADRGMAPD